MDLLNRFRNFMYGRYGFDAFGRFLFLLSLVFWGLSLIFRFTPLKSAYYVFWALNLIIYIYAFFRIFSKNIVSRAAENERYLRVRERVMPKLDRLKQEKLDRNYVFKRCPHCNSRLRLRRIKGKHTTRCPKCGTQFTVRIFFGTQQ